MGLQPTMLVNGAKNGDKRDVFLFAELSLRKSRMQSGSKLLCAS